MIRKTMNYSNKSTPKNIFKSSPTMFSMANTNANDEVISNLNVSNVLSDFLKFQKKNSLEILRLEDDDSIIMGKLTLNRNNGKINK